MWSLSDCPRLIRLSRPCGFNRVGLCAREKPTARTGFGYDIAGTTLYGASFSWKFYLVLVCVRDYLAIGRSNHS